MKEMSTKAEIWYKSRSYEYVSLVQISKNILTPNRGNHPQDRGGLFGLFLPGPNFAWLPFLNSRFNWLVFDFANSHALVDDVSEI